MSPTSNKDVKKELGEQVDYILKGDKCNIGIESTIIKINCDLKKIIIQRKGMIDKHILEKNIGYKIQYSKNLKKKYVLKVPGNSYLHYCSKAIIIIVKKPQKLIKALLKIRLKIGLISFLPFQEKFNKNLIHINISQSEDLYAKNIYKNLRFFDKKEVDLIIMESIPDNRKWLGIIDRIKKACLKKKEMNNYKNLLSLFFKK